MSTLPVGLSRKRVSGILHMVSVLVGLLLITGFVSFQNQLSPFSSRLPYTDSSGYAVIGKLMTQGYVPYRDFFDHKGPVLHFIEYFGYSVGGLRGIWLVEFVMLFCAAMFAYRVARFWLPPFPAWLSASLSFMPSVISYEGGNLSEGYALVFFFFSLYAFLLHFRKPESIRPFHIIFAGVSFACVLLIRANMIGIWLGFCLSILVQFWRKKEWSRLWRYLLFFMLGALAVIVPVILYLVVNQAFAAFVEQAFMFNFTYVGYRSTLSGLYVNVMGILAQRFWVLIPIACLLWCVQKLGKEDAWFYYGYVLACVVNLASFVFHAPLFGHYMLTFLPFLTPVFATLFGRLLEPLSSRPPWLANAALLLVGVLLSTSLLSGGLSIIRSNASANEAEAFDRARVLIEEHVEEDRRIAVVGNISKFYLYDDFVPASKYFYSTPLAYVSKEIAASYRQDIVSNPPPVIVVTYEVRDEFSHQDSPFFFLNELLQGYSFVGTEYHSDIYAKNGGN